MDYLIHGREATPSRVQRGMVHYVRELLGGSRAPLGGGGAGVDLTTIVTAGTLTVTDMDHARD